MAFPHPTIVFNNSTGSDTAASGAGPSTAVTGTVAAHTSGSASTTITLTNSPDLSGVATNGSAAIWLKTSSGRQFSRITGVDNSAKTVTVEDSFNIASGGSAVNYAIGGKRLTLHNADSFLLFTADMKAGWKIEIQYTGSDYQWCSSTGSVTWASNSAETWTEPGVHVFGTGVSKPNVLQNQGNLNTFTVGDGTRFSNIRLTCPTGSDVYTKGPQALAGLYVESCELIWPGNQGISALYCSARGTFINNYFEGIKSGAVLGALDLGGDTGYNGSHYIKGNYFYNCTAGVYFKTDFSLGNTVEDNWFHDCLKAVHTWGTGNLAQAFRFIGNTFYNSVLYLDGGSWLYVIIGNIFANSTSYGIYLGNADWAYDWMEKFNKFYSNATADISGSVAIHSSSTTGVNPQFTNPSGKDLSIGSNLRQTGPWAGVNLGASSTANYPDPGAAQRTESGGGGGGGSSAEGGSLFSIFDSFIIRGS